jgi:exodeoxyribonuclease VII large subunit
VIAQIYSVSHLTTILKGIIEDDEDLQDLWLDGEISNLTIARSGHAYFSLKDDGSQFRAVMWRHALSRQKMVPREGDRVIVHGNVTVYQPRGEVQLQVDVLQPQGTGILQLRLEELRQRLDAEGLFDPSRKRQIPAIPRRIGVVTSSSGAVWHDIQHVVSRRFPLGELILAPATVQGESAPASLVDALRAIQDQAEPDVIIIGRGGGSLEDLWAFNDERVVRAIYAARVPVISAVGHETDWTLADEVADLRAPTPSAAAELAVPDLVQIDQALEDTGRRLQALIRDQFDRGLQRVDDLAERLARVSPKAGMESMQRELTLLQDRLSLAMRYNLTVARREMVSMEEILHALSPQGLLSRGYSFVEDPKTGTPIRSVLDIQRGSSIRAHVSDGCFTANVTDVISNSDSIVETGDKE